MSGGDDDLAVVGDKGIYFPHQPNKRFEGKQGLEDGEGMGDDGEEAVDAIFYFSGGLVDEGYFVDCSLLVYYGAGDCGHILVGGSAVGVEHSGECEGFGVDFAHGTFGVIENDVVF